MRYFLLSAIVLFYCNAFAQDMQRVKSNLHLLASPEMHGRGYVNNGDKLVATWIASAFHELGLQNLSDNYLQKFTLPVNIFPDKLMLSQNGSTLVPGEEYIVNAISRSGKGKGKLYIFDTLVFSDLNKRQQFLNQNLSKKVCAFNNSFYQKLAESPDGLLDKIYTAKAVLAINEKLIASISSHQLSQPVFNVKNGILKPNSNIKYKVDAKLEAKYTTQNVVGFLKGTLRPDSIIVIGAHYDHLGRMGNDILFPGANDNASGITMLIEMADYYAKNPAERKYSMCFIAFGAEEAGLVGSNFFVKHPLVPLSAVKFMINLDLVGTGDDGIAVVNAIDNAREYQKLEEINKKESYFPYIKKRGNAANSDHYYFSQVGIKSMFFYTLGGTQAYHDIHDKPETLPLTKYKELFQLIIKFVDRI